MRLVSESRKLITGCDRLILDKRAEEGTRSTSGLNVGSGYARSSYRTVRNQKERHFNRDYVYKIASFNGRQKCQLISRKVIF